MRDTERISMTIRKQLEILSKECEGLCHRHGFVGPRTGVPNFRLIYTSVETYEHGNGFVIIGLNPGGDETDADTDKRDRPFREDGYSAYLDDNWRCAGEGQDDFQRTVQGIAMIVTGSTPSEAMSAIKSPGLTPVARIGSDAADFLRHTPSLNIIPFRHSSLVRVPPALRDRGQQIGWELLCLMQPKPEYIITLANGVDAPIWRTILRNGRQSSSASFEAVIHQTMRRTYREARIAQGQLAGTTLIGLPAVVRDQGREDVTVPMFEILSQRVLHHGIGAAFGSA